MIPKIVYQDNGRAFRAKYFTDGKGFTELGFNGLYAKLGSEKNMIIEYPEKNITDNSKNIKIKGVAEYNENERLSLEIEIISNNQAKPLIVVMLNPSIPNFE